MALFFFSSIYWYVTTGCLALRQARPTRDSQAACWSRHIV